MQILNGQQFYFAYPDTGLIFMNKYNGFTPGSRNNFVKTFNYVKTVNGPGDTVFTFSSQVIDTTIPGYINDCSFTNNMRGFAVSEDGNIYETSNGGNNWSGTYSNSGFALNRVSFPDQYTGYAVGNGGSIIKYRVPTAINKISRNDILIYPNPTGDFINIKGLSAPNVFSYSIVDLTGKKIGYGKLNQSGKIELTGISSGTYLIELENRSEKMRVIFIKSEGEY